ncbi:MAG TPA: hypothetical protein VKE69_11705 [Planctomycetota bacterium]|nr:hypothetical protein [Planctomycetota bacterium]
MGKRLLQILVAATVGAVVTVLAVKGERPTVSLTRRVVASGRVKTGYRYSEAVFHAEDFGPDLQAFLNEPGVMLPWELVDVVEGYEFWYAACRDRNGAVDYVRYAKPTTSGPEFRFSYKMGELEVRSSRTADWTCDGLPSAPSRRGASTDREPAGRGEAPPGEDARDR